MSLTKQEIKKRCFDKKYAEAKTIECSCGCKKTLKCVDHYGRIQKFINGHNGRKYDDPFQYQREWRHRNRVSILQTKMERGRRLKAKVVGLMGGKCSSCGLEYNGKNACVFQLHHIDTKNKLFMINAKTLVNYAWIKILDEIKKCVLLCANCHFMAENEEY
jgi:hypothetical protein